MLARSYRLRLGRDIENVYRRGKAVGAGNLRIKLTPNGLDLSRAVVVISTKVSKRATIRNRARRQVTALMQEEWQTIRPGYDIVVNVYSDLADLTRDELARQFGSLVTKARLKKES